MRFACRAKVGFDTEVDLHRPGLEPRTAALGELRRLRDFGNAERSCIELARDVFLSGGHRELHVIGAGDAHVRPTPTRAVWRETRARRARPAADRGNRMSAPLSSRAAA